jgi:hypothetical protein
MVGHYDEYKKVLFEEFGGVLRADERATLEGGVTRGVALMAQYRDHVHLSLTRQSPNMIDLNREASAYEAWIRSAASPERIAGLHLRKSAQGATQQSPQQPVRPTAQTYKSADQLSVKRKAMWADLEQRVQAQTLQDAERLQRQRAAEAEAAYRQQDGRS